MDKSFVIYIAAICCYAFGFADFTMITLHAAKTGAFPAASLSLLYALAMAVDASAALFFGWLLGALYDFDPVYLVIVSVAAQACSIPFYVLCIKVRKA